MDKFGLELAVKVHEGDINSKRDKIAVVIHWCLLKKGLSFSGIGDNFSNDDGKLTEILPANWNQSDFTWKYREIKNKPNKFILKLFQDGEILNAILVRLSDEVSKDFSVDLKKDLFNDVELAGGKYHLVKEDDFLQKVFDALLKDFFPEPKPAAIENPERARQPPIQPPGGPRQGGVPRSPFGENPDPLRIGGRDLDPFGNPMGGGMIMEPPGRGGRHGGPGAGPRFDPVFPGMPSPGLGPHPGPGRGGPRGPGRGGPSGGPFGGGRNFGDELPPPGYDDMFM